MTGERDAFLPFSEALAERNPHGDLVVVPGGHFGCPAPRVATTIVAATSAWPVIGTTCSR